MNHSFRQYTRLDRLCESVDRALRTLSGQSSHTNRPYPAETKSSSLSDRDQQHVAGLMRVNHAGEVCAQALYHGQASVSRNLNTRSHLHQAALEEGDHLHWCEQRLAGLNSHPSRLNPVWYAGSFLIGVMAGSISDAVSLGFVAETETQVMKHLKKHLESLPECDEETKKVLEIMHDDEAKHRQESITAGAISLPFLVRKMMALASKVMVNTAYYV